METISSPRSIVTDAGLAERDFLARFPEFDPDGTLAALRREEYSRLDATGSVYLDYTGGSLYAVGQVRAHARFLERHVLGNPHSNNPASLASTTIVEAARRRVLDFFRAPPGEYLCVFTANASAALKLVGESYPFAPGGTLALTADNHNSVNGLREFARRGGAALRYLPIEPPDLRVDRRAIAASLGAARSDAARLLAFPAQSNFSGVQHPLDLVAEAHGHGWDVLVDASAYVPTNPFDVSATRPDFVAASFYKLFGYPTGVGCLLMRRGAAARLVRPWFAGGTVTVASVAADGHYPAPDEARFEDGTVDYLNLAAVTIGLDHLERLGVDAIGRRVRCLTGWLLETVATLRHGNGRALVRVLGPTDTTDRGGTVAFVLDDCAGRRIDSAVVEALANRAGISLRSGCFCNPGAGEAAFGLGAEQLRPWFGRPAPVTYEELRDGLRTPDGHIIAAVRASLGIASTFSDVHRLAVFLSGFLDGHAEDLHAGTRPDMR